MGASAEWKASVDVYILRIENILPDGRKGNKGEIIHGIFMVVRASYLDKFPHTHSWSLPLMWPPWLMPKMKKNHFFAKGNNTEKFPQAIKTCLEDHMDNVISVNSP